MVGAHQNLNGSHDLITPRSEMVCHPWVSTCYDQSMYVIWSRYIHPLWSYERRYKMWKTMVVWKFVIWSRYLGWPLTLNHLNF